MPSISKKTGLLLFAGLILLSSVFFFYRLGSAFLDYDEATYAQVTKEAMASNNFSSFTLWGNSWIDKPPMYFWLAIGSAKIFGFNEMALRLPGALAGMLGVILTWLLAFHLSKNYFTAFLSAAILAFSGEFAFAARQFRLDVPVAASVIASVYFFVRGWKNGKWYLAMGASLAFGVLTKSIVGLFAGPAILGFCLAYKKWDWLKSGYFWAGVLVFLGLAAPWHIIEAQKFGGAFWSAYIGHHLFARYVSEVVGTGITVKHYFKYLFTLVEPWFPALIIAALWNFFRHGKDLRGWDRLGLASFLAFTFLFLIFAVSKTKLFYYLEPIYPFMALFISASMVNWAEQHSLAGKKVFVTAGVLIVIGILGTNWQVFNRRDGFSEEYAVAAEERTAGESARPEPNVPIYAAEWYWHETLSYYAERKVVMLPSEIVSPDPFYLVMPSFLLKLKKPSADFRARAKVIFEGENITLFKLSARQ